MQPSDASRVNLYTSYRHTFFQSYGVNLPSSLTTVLSSALGFSPCPPVSVWGTVYIIISLEAFPGSRASTTSPPWWLVSCLSLKNPDLPKFSAYALSLGQPTPSLPSLLRPSITDYISTRILTRFPSTTHFCLALGADLPCPD